MALKTTSYFCLKTLHAEFLAAFGLITCSVLINVGTRRQEHYYYYYYSAKAAGAEPFSVVRSRYSFICTAAGVSSVGFRVGRCRPSLHYISLKVFVHVKPSSSAAQTRQRRRSLSSTAVNAAVSHVRVLA